MGIYNCGFIGTGNMGSALARAVCQKIDPHTVVVADKYGTSALELAEKLGCDFSDNSSVAKNSKLIFLGVKPQSLAELLAEITPIIVSRSEKPVLVSMAAGVSIDKIKKMSYDAAPVIRIMPNTAAAVGEGMILFDVSGEVSREEINFFTEALSRAGRIDRINERLIDAASAVSGCGPAYAYMFIEALADGAVECGLPRAAAIEYAAQTLLGAAKMVLESGKHPEKLKDEVCSPGGTTIAGVHALEKGAFRASVMEAVVAAYEKTKALGQK